MPLLSVWVALSSALLHAVANTTARSALRTASPITASLMLVWIQWILFSLLLVPAGGFSNINVVGLLLFCAAGLLTPLLFIVFFFTGIQRIGAARATTIKSAAPIYAVICAVAFLGERPTALRYLGIAAVMAGVLSLVWETADKKGSKTGRMGRRSDYVFPLLAGVCAGVSAILNKAGLSRMDTPLLSAWIGATEAVLLFPLVVRVFPKADRYRIGSQAGLAVAHTERGGLVRGRLLPDPVHQAGRGLDGLHAGPDLAFVRGADLGAVPPGAGAGDAEGGSGGGADRRGRHHAQRFLTGAAHRGLNRRNLRQNTLG